MEIARSKMWVSSNLLLAYVECRVTTYQTAARTVRI